MTKDRDKELSEKLRAEWLGILSWMIGGCLKWQSTGLRPPQAVVAATKSYLDAEDFDRWVDERPWRSVMHAVGPL